MLSASDLKDLKANARKALGMSAHVARSSELILELIEEVEMHRGECDVEAVHGLAPSVEEPKAPKLTIAGIDVPEAGAADQSVAFLVSTPTTPKSVEELAKQLEDDLSGKKDEHDLVIEAEEKRLAEEALAKKAAKAAEDAEAEAAKVKKEVEKAAEEAKKAEEAQAAEEAASAEEEESKEEEAPKAESKKEEEKAKGKGKKH